MLKGLFMAITYKISRWNSPFRSEAVEFAVKKNSQSAKLALRQFIYRMLESEALLDRPIAYQLMRKAEFAQITPKRGEFIQQHFALRDSLGPFVEIYVTRD